MQVVLRAEFDPWSDDGQDAISLAVAMEKFGLDVTPVPMSIRPGLPRAFTRLLEKNPWGPKDVAITFGPPSRVAPAEYAGMARFNVGYAMPWAGEPHGWNDLDLVFVSSPADRERLGRDSVVAPIGFDESVWQTVRRDPLKPLRVLVREETQGVNQVWEKIEATDPAFDGDLLLAHDGLTRAELAALFQTCDVLVVTSEVARYGAEFAATGGVVIDRFGLQENWIHSDVGIVADGRSLLAALQWCRENRADVARMGERAAKWVRETMDWPVVIDGMVRKLEALG